MQVRLSICFLLLSLQLFGQEFVLKQVELKNERNSYLISSAPFVDKDGFVWYATNRDGEFYRLDGNHRLSYSYFKDKAPHADSYVIPRLAWAQDAAGNIWAAEPEHVYIINPHSASVKRIRYSTQLAGEPTFIAIDPQQNTWISNASKYLIKIDSTKRVTKIGHPILAKTKSPLYIVKITADKKIVARAGYDLFIVDGQELRFMGNLKQIDPQLNEGYGVMDNGILFKKNSSGYYNYQGRSYRYIYVKTLDLQFFDYPKASLHRNDWNNKFLAIGNKFLVASDKNIYINQIDRQNDKISLVDSISFKMPIAFNTAKYNSSVVWIAGHRELYKLRVTPNLFTKMLQFKDKSLSTRGIVSDKKGNLFIGTYDGLYVRKPNQNERKVTFPDGKPNDFYDDLLLEKGSQVMWAFFAGNQIRRIDLNTNQSRIFQLQQFLDVNCMIEKSANELWLGTNQGLFIFDKKAGTLKIDTESYPLLANLAIYDISPSKSGKIWLATGKGLFFKDEVGHTKRYQNSNQLIHRSSIFVLHQSSEGNLWMGTYNNGLIYLNLLTGQSKVYNTTNGLSNNTVAGILESKQALWFSTFYGLSRFDKQKAAFTLFYKEDGLPENEFNLRSVYKKNDSTFYFGGLNGIVEFNPEAISHQMAYPNRIFLFSASYFSKAKKKDTTEYLNMGEKVIELPYHKNYFSAKFSINELFYNEKNTFSYKIDGLTHDWVDMGTLGNMELFGLPPGKHVIQVRAKDAKGIESANELQITLDVAQVFYRTGLFRLLIFSLMIGLISGFFVWRSNKQKLRFKREKEMIMLRASALKAQMNPHFIFNILNNMQSVLILKGEREVNKYFAAFSRLLRLTLDMSKQDLVSLNDELDYIKSYLLLTNLQQNNQLQYSITVDNTIKDSMAIFLPGMLLQPFVENAIIHGLATKKDKRLSITCYIVQATLTVEIEDNGIGRTAAAQLAKHRKDLHRSWATHIVNERIHLLGPAFDNKKTISLDIQDLEKDGEAMGTKVTIRVRLKIGNLNEIGDGQLQNFDCRR